jgi:hypothetical protein
MAFTITMAFTGQIIAAAMGLGAAILAQLLADLSACLTGSEMFRRAAISAALALMGILFAAAVTGAVLGVITVAGALPIGAGAAIMAGAAAISGWGLIVALLKDENVGPGILPGNINADTKCLCGDCVGAACSVGPNPATAASG